MDIVSDKAHEMKTEWFMFVDNEKMKMGVAKINLLNIRAIALFLLFQFSKDLAIETEFF